ncbi:hypothetical protein JKF63_04968 [Porcisia hertigi]|uniref:Uncharacterized protein n=1 Tax=Porcisia hertigi TaxID=2761500 RepID=A0A836L9Y7_9TRYP|nr:hypothetical protein JKF63_04968 [Porcisia hertigi]
MPAKHFGLKRPAEAPLHRTNVDESLAMQHTPASSSTTPTATSTVEEVEAPKVVMSKAQRRRLKKPPVVVTAEMKATAREETRELRKQLRILKSNGARRKMAKLHGKRPRESDPNEEAASAFDRDCRPHKKGRRLE